MRAAGFEVIASARREDDLEALRVEGFKAVHIDNSDTRSVEGGFAAALELASDGRVWGVFCNAGYGQLGALEDITVDCLRAQLETNVIGTHALVRVACAHMRERGGGRILINSSVLGVVGMKLRGAYVASKFALEGLADVLRLEVADVSIGIGLLEPGPVYTRFRANALLAFREHVAPIQSRHTTKYSALQKKLATEGPVVPFTMSAEDCARIAMRAFTDQRVKPRYRATVQTHVFSALKRMLPARWMDRIAARG